MKKTIIIIVIILTVIFILFFLYCRYPSVAILGYHNFTENNESTDDLTIPINQFEEQLQYLKENHYYTLSLDELYQYKQGKKKIPIKSVLITMDDGYQSNYDLAFPLLKKYNMKAVVFYIGENIEKNDKNYMSKEILEKVKTEYPNIEIASHTYQLHKKGSIEKDKEELEEDFNKMDTIISTKYLAYPYGDHNKKIKEILKERKYKLAFTFGPNKEHRKMQYFDSNYEIPRLNISNNMPLWKFALRIQLPF